MKDFTTQFKAHAKQAGVDLIGIAPISRFEDVSPEHHPASIFPEVKTVVVIGKRIARGALRGVEEGTQFDIYGQYGRDWLSNRILAMATFRTAEFLEDNRWEAVPLQDLPKETPPMGVSVRPGQPPPNVMIDLEDAAVRAGLGEIGYCGFFLTPEFGPRQRLQIILTDAELEPDSIPEEAICDYCADSVAFCPLGALNPEVNTAINVCGKEMVTAEISYDKCRVCKNGAGPNPYHPSGKPDRLGAICARSCLDRLEQSGKLKNVFRNPFRKREPWGVIEERRIL